MPAVLQKPSVDDIMGASSRPTVDDIMSAQKPTVDDIMGSPTQAAQPSAGPMASLGEHVQHGARSAAQGAAEFGASMPEFLGFMSKLSNYVRGIPPEARMVGDKDLGDVLDEAGGAVRGLVDKAPWLFGIAGLVGKRSEKVEQEPPGIAKSLATTIPSGAANLAVTLATGGVGEAATGIKAATLAMPLFGAQMTASGYEDVKQWSGDEGKALASGLLNGVIGTAGGAVLGGLLEKIPAEGRKAIVDYALQAAKGAGSMAGLSLASDAIAKGLGDPRDRDALRKALEAGALGALTGAATRGLAGSRELKPEGQWPYQPPEHKIDLTGGGESFAEQAPAEAVPREITFEGEPLMPDFWKQVEAQDTAAARGFVERAQTGAPSEVDQMAADDAAGIGASRLADRANPLTSAQLSEERIADAADSARGIVPEKPRPMVPIEPDPHEEAARLMEHGSLEEQIANPLIREHLQTLAAEAGSIHEPSKGVIREGSADLGDRGGRIVLNDSGLAKGTGFFNTPKSNWWKNRPGNMSEAELKKLVARVTSDKPGKITPRQAEMLHFLVGQMPDVGTPVQPPSRVLTEADIPADASPTLRMHMMEQIESGEEIPRATMRVADVPPKPEPVPITEAERAQTAERLKGGTSPAEWQKPEFWRDSPDPMRPAVEQPDVIEHVAEQAKVPIETAAKADPMRVTTLAEIPDVRADPSEGIKAMEKMLADRALLRFNTNKDRVLKERALASIGGSKKAGQAINEAIAFYIDHAQYGDEAWRRYLDIERTTTNQGKTLYPVVEQDRQTFVKSMNLSETERAAADRIIAENRRLGQFAKANDVIDDYFDFFSRRIWKNEGTIAGTGKFVLNPATAKGRTLESIAHGLALGKELAVKGAIDAQASARLQVGEAVLHRNYIETGLKSGFLSNEAEPPQGWKRIDHPAFIRRNISAPPALADRLNGVLATSNLADFTIKGVSPARVLDRIAATYRTSVMSLGYVHHANGIRGALLSGEIHSLADLNPRERMRRGMDIIAGGSAHIEGLVRNGLLPRIGPEFDELRNMERTRFTQKLIETSKKFPEVERGRRWLTDLNDSRHHFLFNEFFPALMVYDGELAARRLFNKNRGALSDGTMSPDDLYKAIAKNVNDRYGVVNRDITGGSGRGAANMRHLANWGLFAPSWTETRFRQLAKMAVGPGGEKAVYREVMGRTIARLAAVHLAWDLAMASIHDDTDKSGKDFGRRFWEQVSTNPMSQLTGVRVTPLMKAFGDQSGSESFLGLSSALMRGIGLIHEPGKEISRIGSWFVHAATEAATGEDQLGRPFTSTSELTGTDDKGVYKTGGGMKTGTPHLPLQAKGGQLAGEVSSYRAAGKGGIKEVQVPSYLISQGTDFVPPPIMGLLYLLHGQARGMQLMLNAAGLDLRRSKAK
jgi:hypothetical protein